MKKIILLLLVTGIFSCNSHLDKSILESLSIKELKKSIDKDTLFKNTYKYIVYVRDSILKSDIDKVKFADLTYNRVHKLAQLSMDMWRSKPINKRIEKEWEEKYGMFTSKIDSVSNYWKENPFTRRFEVSIAKNYYSYLSYKGREIRKVLKEKYQLAFEFCTLDITITNGIFPY